MKSFLRKIFNLSMFSAFLAVFVLSILIPAKNATATNQGGDNCNQETTYTIDEDDESHFTFSESGNRVDVDFNGNSDDRNQAIITAGSGYQIMTVRYDTETSNTNWINFSVSNPTTTINLAGTSDSTRIDKVEVKVKKVCATPTATPTPTIRPTNTPTPTTAPTSTPTPTVTVTNTPTPGACPQGQTYDQGLHICVVIDCPGDGECEVIIGNTPTPTPTEEVTPTPTQTPSSGGQSSTTSDPGTVTVQSAVEEKKGEVTGASKIAPTGAFSSVLATIEQALGMLVLSAGALVYGKKEKIAKKK